MRSPCFACNDVLACLCPAFCDFFGSLADTGYVGGIRSYRLTLAIHCNGTLASRHLPGVYATMVMATARLAMRDCTPRYLQPPAVSFSLSISESNKHGPASPAPCSDCPCLMPLPSCQFMLITSLYLTSPKPEQPCYDDILKDLWTQGEVKLAFAVLELWYHSLVGQTIYT